MRLSTDRTERARVMWAMFGPAVARTLLSYERDLDLRQDLVQEVFLAVLASIDRIEEAKNPKAYLLRVAHNVAIDHVARESRCTWLELDDEVAADADPENDAHAAGERERLLECVRRLRLPYRQVLVC